MHLQLFFQRSLGGSSILSIHLQTGQRVLHLLQTAVARLKLCFQIGVGSVERLELGLQLVQIGQQRVALRAQFVEFLGAFFQFAAQCQRRIRHGFSGFRFADYRCAFCTQGDRRFVPCGFNCAGVCRADLQRRGLAVHQLTDFHFASGGVQPCHLVEQNLLFTAAALYFACKLRTHARQHADRAAQVIRLGARIGHSHVAFVQGGHDTFRVVGEGGVFLLLRGTELRTQSDLTG